MVQGVNIKNMEVVYIEDMELEDFRFVTNMSVNKFPDIVMSYVNQRKNDCLVGFLNNGDQFFTIDNIPSVDSERMEDIILMSSRFMMFNKEVYISYRNLVEWYIDYLINKTCKNSFC